MNFTTKRNMTILFTFRAKSVFSPRLDGGAGGMWNNVCRVTHLKNLRLV